MRGGGARRPFLITILIHLGHFGALSVGGRFLLCKSKFSGTGAPLGFHFGFTTKNAPSFKKAWFSPTWAPLGLNAFCGTGAPLGHLGHHFGCVGALFTRK